MARTQQDVAAAVQSLAAEGAQEFVLDLRNNLGGLVEEGIEVARLFLDGNSRTADLSSNERRKVSRLPGCSLMVTPSPLSFHPVNERRLPGCS